MKQRRSAAKSAKSLSGLPFLLSARVSIAVSHAVFCSKVTLARVLKCKEENIVGGEIAKADTKLLYAFVYITLLLGVSRRSEQTPYKSTLKSVRVLRFP